MLQILRKGNRKCACVLLRGIYTHENNAAGKIGGRIAGRAKQQPEQGIRLLPFDKTAAVKRLLMTAAAGSDGADEMRTKLSQWKAQRHVNDAAERVNVHATPRSIPKQNSGAPLDDAHRLLARNRLLRLHRQNAALSARVKSIDAKCAVSHAQ